MCIFPQPCNIKELKFGAYVDVRAMSRSFGLISSKPMQNKTRIYTVSQVNSLIKAALEEKLPSRLSVTGEITNWMIAQSGHAYFDLKDENSLLPCVIWKSKLSRVKFGPENGQAVIVKGYIDVYSPHGKYQFYAESMTPAGIGALQLAFEQMVKKLRAEGLFDDKYKKPLPAYPQRIGILTSESGAAVHDITDSIHNRWPCAKLFLYPVPVQGERAAGKIAKALRDVNKRNKKLRLDVLIVGRGGGSLEDLWAFNEEVLARAIFRSTIPIICAVGHEVDTTIADLVADARASTPTKAGMVCVPDMMEVLGRLDYFQKSLNSKARWNLELCRKSLQTLLASSVFRNPLWLVRNGQQQLDELAAELTETAKELLVEARARLHRSYEQVVRIEPHRLLGRKTLDLSNLQNQANALISAIVNNCRMQLTARANKLEGLNPKSVLQRGYSITTNKKTGLVIRKPKDVQIGDLLITDLANEDLIERKLTKQ